jgi:phospholipid transport system substrate-binding protein
MPTRRALLLCCIVAPLAVPARAQSAEQALAFVDQTAKQLVGVINGPGSPDQKRAQLQQIIDRAVAVDEVARFCLGRFWRSATPEQQHEYLELFHRVLLNSIAGHMGEYQGVTYTLGRAMPGEGGISIASVISRPGQPPVNFIWVIGNEAGNPKIVDLIVEGTSLRVTQRSDYASYLARNSNSVQALLDAMRRQLAAAG